MNPFQRLGVKNFKLVERRTTERRRENDIELTVVP